MSAWTEHLTRFAAFRDLAEHEPADFLHDLAPAVAVTILAVPQGVAYALIAGLPPVMGLYACVVPALVGSLFRSSSHVVTGPTNALSLLVGTVVAAHTGSDPIVMATTLAVMTGAMQLLAGFLRLGAVVDYISTPVIVGYITGAGTLIAVGQLAHATGSPAARGDVLSQLSTWLDGLDGFNPVSLGLSVGTLGVLALLQRLDERMPGAILVMGAGIALSVLLDLTAHGVVTVADIAPIPRGAPALTLPAWEQIPSLLSPAVACMVLSFVESSSVARAIAHESGQKLDTSAELAGQGLANLAGGVTGSFVTSGSLTRSAMNHRAGARTRASAALSGALMLGVLLSLGPVVNYTPVPVLAGLLLMVAVRLIDLRRIRQVLTVELSDAVAFLATLIATWALPLDVAIEVGIAISIILFLRRARLIVARELSPDSSGRLLEQEVGAAPGASGSPIRFVHFEGSLFFGAAGEMRDALESILDEPGTRVLILRLHREQRLDYSSAEALAALGKRMKERNQHLLLVGMTSETLALLRRAGVTAELGDEHVFPTERGLFHAAARAVERAARLVDESVDDDPLVRWARRELEQRPSGEVEVLAQR